MDMDNTIHDLILSPTADTTSTIIGDHPPPGTMPIYLKIVIGILLVLVILVSIFGNLLVCVSIASDRRLRRLGNIFLVSLAIADLCVGALVMTFALANDLMEYWPFWPQLCEIWIAFDISCSTCSIINLCAIALDRFAHIKDPMLYNRWMNKRIVIASVSIIWMVSSVIAFVPISLGWHKPLPQSMSLMKNKHNQQNYSSTTMKTFLLANLSEQQEHRPNNNILEPLLIKRLAHHSTHYMLFSPMFINHTMAVGINASPSYYLPPPIFTEEDEDQQQVVAILRHSRHSSENNHQMNEQSDMSQNTINPSMEQWPQCALDLTPTYAVVSSCISFYFPCLIMLCLYARLYSICQQHVKSIKSMTKMTAFGPSAPVGTDHTGTSTSQNLATNHNNISNRPSATTTMMQQQQQSHVSEHKAAITLGIIMGTFLACWMPFFCMNIVAAYCKTCIPASVFKVLTWLGYFNSCLNPAIYSIFNTEFRDAFRRILIRYVFNSEMSQWCRGICETKNVNITATNSAIDIQMSKKPIADVKYDDLEAAAVATVVEASSSSPHHSDHEKDDHLVIAKTNHNILSDYNVRKNELNTKDESDSEILSTELEKPSTKNSDNILKFNQPSTVEQQQQEKRHNNLQLYNSYSFDHSTSSTTTIQQYLPSTTTHPQMSSDLNLRLLKQNIYSKNNFNHNKERKQQQHFSPITPQKQTLIRKESFDL